MTNPFKKIAPALFLRGALFALLGLVLLAKTVPSLLNLEQGFDIAGGVIGAFLLTFGVMDLFGAAQRFTRLRTEKLDFSAIDFAYVSGSGGAQIPRTLMDSDRNPNEAGQASLIEWLARVFPKLAYLPYPYTAALHSVLIALGIGLLGLLLLLMLRIVMAEQTGQEQLANILDWYQWLYLVLGLAFWAAVSRFGFARALLFQGSLMPKKIVGLFLLLLVLAVVYAISTARTGATLAAPPDLGALPLILWVGSLLVIAATIALVFLRGKRSVDRYAVAREEEFFTVGMHPTDMINCVKSFTGKLGEGIYMHLGSWKPAFKEHTAVQAGEFDADLNAESNIQLNDSGTSYIDTTVGMALAWIGILVTSAAGFLLWQSADASWDTVTAALMSLRTPIALLVFGSLLYRLGAIAVAELAWTSILTYCHIDGTFQAQGGMSLMNAGETTVKGSVLTTATVQPRCAYLTSVGFLQPGLAKCTVVRVIDQVDTAGQVTSDLLAAIHHQCNQMTAAGAPVAAPNPVLLDQSEASPQPVDAADSSVGEDSTAG